MCWIRCLVMLLGILLSFLAFAPVSACPFCASQGQTMTVEADRASFVVFGTLTDARPNADLDGGTTVMQVEAIVKDHPFLKGKKSLVIPRYIPVLNEKEKIKFLIFCDLLPQDRIDPVRGMPARKNDIVEYLQGALKVKDKDAPSKLEFFFKYLDNSDIEISVDAYNEFAKADYKDVTNFVEKSDKAKLAAKLVEWLRNKDTAAYRYGLYGLLIGACGTEKEAAVLAELLSDPERGLVSGIDGVLAGYVTLRPKEGWQYVRDILGNPKKEFTRRYAALRTVRFFWEYRTDLVSKKELVDGLSLLLDQGDIADLAMEDLRKWKQWEQTDRILDLKDRESHNIPIIQRAILRYALSCPPEYKRAAEFVEEQRKRDPERVKDVEALLKAENDFATAK